MAALKLNTPSLAAVKSALPTYAGYAEDEEDKRRRRAASGPQLGEAAMQHAEEKAEAERTAARRALRNKKFADHADIGYVESHAEVRRLKEIAASTGEVDASVEAIAADLARFTKVIDKRAEWTPIAELAAAPTAERAPAGRRPGSGAGWGQWGSTSKKGAGGAGGGAPAAASGGGGGAAARPARPGTAAPQTRPRLTEGVLMRPGSAGSLSGAAAAQPKPAAPPDKNLVNASFNTGYSYTPFLGAGSMFFSALEAVVRDHAVRNEPPLPLRLPPTIVLGLSQIGGGDQASDPLWLWSDVSTGGGLRAMRQPIVSAEAALDFLAGAECVAAVAAVPETPPTQGEAEEQQHHPTGGSGGGGGGSTGGGGSGGGGGDGKAAARDGADDRRVEEGAEGGESAAALERQNASRNVVSASRFEAARDRVLDSACGVLKLFSQVRGGMQETRILSVRRLAKILNGLQKGDSKPSTHDGAGGGAAGTPAAVFVLQRFVQPPVSRASVVRVQHRHVDGHEPRPLRGFQLDAVSQIRRPQPSGTQLDEPESWAMLTACSGTPGALARPINCRGGVEWNEISTLIRQMCFSLRRALNLHFEEIVLEVILTPRAPSPWWLTQIKAFKSVQKEPLPTALKPARFRATVDRSTSTKCVGDYCLCKGGRHGSKAAQGRADLGGGPTGAAGGSQSLLLDDESALDAPPSDPDGADPATRRIPYRWLVFDRLNASVKNRVDDGFDEGNYFMGGSNGQDSAQLHGLGRLVIEDQPGEQYGDKDIRRNTIGSSCRAATLRRLYTPASVRRGRPLVCVSAARLYDEVPVCHECYHVYSTMADDWKKKPTALLSVASAPALGLIGAPISELPSELLGTAAAASDAPDGAAAVSSSGSPGKAGKSPHKAQSSGGLTPVATPASPSAGAPSTAGAPAGAANPGTPGAPGTPGTAAKRNERSHSMHALLKNTVAAKNNSPFALAQRFAFLNHCLCCNVLCRACVLGDEDHAKMAEMAKKSGSAQTPDRRRQKLALALQKGEEMLGHATKPTVAQSRWRSHKTDLVAEQRRKQAERDYLEGKIPPPGEKRTTAAAAAACTSSSGGDASAPLAQ